MIRQNGAQAPAVAIRMLEILALVAEQERDPHRLAALRIHADKVVSDARKLMANKADLRDLMARRRAFGAVAAHGGPARRAKP